MFEKIILSVWFHVFMTVVIVGLLLYSFHINDWKQGAVALMLWTNHVAGRARP